MNSYAKIEQRLYDDFIRFGYNTEVARAIAYSFTQYVLGYLTEQQVADCLEKSGVAADLRPALLASFRAAKRNAHASDAQERDRRLVHDHAGL